MDIGDRTIKPEDILEFTEFTWKEHKVTEDNLHVKLNTFLVTAVYEQYIQGYWQIGKKILRDLHTIPKQTLLESTFTINR